MVRVRYRWLGWRLAAVQLTWKPIFVAEAAAQSRWIDRARSGLLFCVQIQTQAVQICATKQQDAHGARAIRVACGFAEDSANRFAYARALHDCDTRRDAPFVAVRSDGVSLSGQPVGGQDWDDWFEQAAGSTLFIDDVARLSSRAQVRLLSCLTREAVRRVPSAAARHVRVITGSDRSLGADVMTGAFSDALFYRLNVIHLKEVEPGEK